MELMVSLLFFPLVRFHDEWSKETKTIQTGNVTETIPEMCLPHHFLLKHFVAIWWSEFHPKMPDFTNLHKNLHLYL